MLCDSFKTLLAISFSLASVNLEAHVFRKVESPYESCKEKILIEFLDYRDRRAEIDSLVTRLGSERVQVLPPTGIGVTRIEAAPWLSNLDHAKDLSPVVLLSETGLRVKAQVENAMLETEKMLACFAQTPGMSFDFLSTFSDWENTKALAMEVKRRQNLAEEFCKPAREQMKILIKAAQKKARIHLALSQGSTIAIPTEALVNPSGVVDPRKLTKSYMFERLEEVRKIEVTPQMRLATNFYTKDLNSIATALRPIGMEELTKEEEQTVLTFVNSFSEKYNPLLDRLESLSNYGPLPLKEAFHTHHRLKYYSMLQEVPVLVYLSQSRLDGIEGDKAIFWAVASIYQNAKSQFDSISLALKEADETGTAIDRNLGSADQSSASWKMIDFLLYQQLIERQLRVKPRRCAIATGLSFHAENSGYRMGIIAGGVLVLASGAYAALAPPVALFGWTLSSATSVSLLLGPALGFADTADNYFNYMAVKQGAFYNIGKSEGQAILIDPYQVESSWEEFKFNSVIDRLGFMGNSYIAKIVFYSILEGASIEGRAFIKTKTAKELLREAKSENNFISLAAQSEIAEQSTRLVEAVFGQAPGRAEQYLVAVMATHGFLGSTISPDLSCLDQVGGVLAEMPDPRRSSKAQMAGDKLAQEAKRYNAADCGEILKLLK